MPHISCRQILLPVYCDFGLYLKKEAIQTDFRGSGEAKVDDLNTTPVIVSGEM